MNIYFSNEYLKKNKIISEIQTDDLSPVKILKSNLSIMSQFPELFFKMIENKSNFYSFPLENIINSGTQWFHPFLNSNLSTCLTMGQPLEKAFTVDAFHSAIILPAQTISPHADGHYLFCKTDDIYHYGTNTSLAIKTADCLSLVFKFQDKNHTFIANIHTGWKGYSNHMILNLFQIIQKICDENKIKHDYFLQNLFCFISAPIFGDSYPCKNDVLLALQNHFLELEKISEIHASCKNFLNDQIVSKNDLIYPDLQCLATCELLHLGINIQNISLFRENTYNHDVLYSYR